MCCGHITDFRLDKIRNKSYECKACLDKEISRYYTDIGLTVVERPFVVGCVNRSRGSRYVKFNSCGHFKEVQIVHAKEGIVACKECMEEKVVSEFLSLGYTVIPSVDNTIQKRYTRLVRINKCGHLKELQLVHAQEGHVGCKECITNRLEKEAISAGIYLLGASVNKNRNCRNYKLPCGCSHDFYTSNVEKGCWNCSKCNTTHLDKESSIYLYEIKSGDYSWLKLGYSHNSEYRKNSYGLDNTAECLLLFNRKLPTGRLAKRIEQNIHKSLCEYRLPREDMKLFMSANGHTECYPISMKGEILDVLMLETECEYHNN
jgi:hypothetical protein